MSIASASRTIKFISKGGTYVAMLMSPSGDLYQEYEGSTVYPDFSQTQPILYLVVTSSRVAEGITTPDAVNFYFNDTLLTWGTDNLSTGTYAGYFKKIFPSDGQPYYGIQILQNIAEAALYASAVIKAEASISYQTQSDTIQASYTIQISQATGNSLRATIAAGDSNNFVITTKGGSCILKALLYQAGNEITTGLTYYWEKMGVSGWEELGVTTQTLTVSDSDIDTYGEFRVTITYGDQSASDTQGVMDATDPYEIDAGASPEDETISEDTTGNDTVTYTPKVVVRGTSNAYSGTYYLSFVVKDAAGVILSNSAYQAKGSTFSVTRDMCEQGGGDLSLTITATTESA